ncbi:hypothetical protein CRENPOLYSF2_3590001 [Crenothrix polyspora]|uniref:Uncharacterized protein n=1 Tax=Crenothrix polyspora TaxID=360316 RepID=A0A1R4HC00_9GAMM|nr:hypothetical protein CRENPOLYSF2_3590001 [Crenothrix polyspora]
MSDIKLDERKVHYEKAMYIIDIENIKPCEFYKQLKDYRQWRLCGIP